MVTSSGPGDWLVLTGAPLGFMGRHDSAARLRADGTVMLRWGWRTGSAGLLAGPGLGEAVRYAAHAVTPGAQDILTYLRADGGKCWLPDARPGEDGTLTATAEQVGLARLLCGLSGGGDFDGYMRRAGITEVPGEREP